MSQDFAFWKLWIGNLWFWSFVQRGFLYQTSLPWRPRDLSFLITAIFFTRFPLISNAILRHVSRHRVHEFFSKDVHEVFSHDLPHRTLCHGIPKNNMSSHSVGSYGSRAMGYQVRDQSTRLDHSTNLSNSYRWGSCIETSDSSAFVS